MSVQKEPCELVFHGNLGYLPNVDAVQGFLDEVLGLIRSRFPGTTFRVIGANPVRAIRELEECGQIRLSPNLEDLRPSVCAGTVYVCPVRRGSGLKNKLLEAMAMAMPVVCYPESASAIEGIDGQHFLIATTPKQFAEHVVNLLRNPSRGMTLGIEARRLMIEKYSWDCRARTYETLYETVRGEALSCANKRDATTPVARTHTARS
jgi:glycosyltransferase involved in cell wall biosynthesis